MIDSILHAVKTLRELYLQDLRNAKAGKDQFFLGKVQACDDITRSIEHIKKIMDKIKGVKND